MKMAERNPREIESRASESRGADNRSSESRVSDNRAAESRAAEIRAKVERFSQANSSMLPYVNEEEGYSMRWIRLSTIGVSDAPNVSQKLQQGWEPVKASDHPEVFLFETGGGKFADTIQIGGLMLCKTPKELTEMHNAKARERAEAEMRAVENNFMRENHPRMPTMFKDHQTKVSKFGREA